MMTQKLLKKIFRKNCFQVTKVTASGYYGIENPLPDVTSKLCHFVVV